MSGHRTRYGGRADEQPRSHTLWGILRASVVIELKGMPCASAQRAVPATKPPTRAAVSTSNRSSPTCRRPSGAAARPNEPSPAARGGGDSGEAERTRVPGSPAVSCQVHRDRAQPRGCARRRDCGPCGTGGQPELTTQPPPSATDNPSMSRNSASSAAFRLWCASARTARRRLPRSMSASSSEVILSPSSSVSAVQRRRDRYCRDAAGDRPGGKTRLDRDFWPGYPWTCGAAATSPARQPRGTTAPRRADSFSTERGRPAARAGVSGMAPR